VSEQHDERVGRELAESRTATGRRRYREVMVSDAPPPAWVRPPSTSRSNSTSTPHWRSETSPARRDEVVPGVRQAIGKR